MKYIVVWETIMGEESDKDDKTFFFFLVEVQIIKKLPFTSVSTSVLAWLCIWE